jgi:hypothetical protein
MHILHDLLMNSFIMLYSIDNHDSLYSPKKVEDVRS